ncbi:DUF2997 domain-containing protein [Anatilimnocola floriformis]|uniref:DUF2997 domain-containing protein n=1 Tax=Anatilimnocola floriformis TaxID=2948575 RepID=UPI0020C22991|nr:DUF2997 domain-containing protein [Anatilimnocola floriformis]
MTKIIEVVVSPKGETKIETKGFVGGECRQASRYIEQALGAQVSERITTEFHQHQARDQTIKEGQI